MPEQRIPEEAYRLAEGAVTHGNAASGGDPHPGVLAELAVDAAAPIIAAKAVEEERERVWEALLDTDAIDEARIAAGYQDRYDQIVRPTHEQMEKAIATLLRRAGLDSLEDGQ